MRRFSPLLFVVAISTPLLAQSVLDESQTKDLIAVTTYCTNVEDYSDSQVPRIFARAISAFGRSTGWVEFDTRAAWIRAGSPKPMALVWYRDAKIVRVAISPNNDEGSRAYGDYCYRQDGTLARLRSLPSVQRKCELDRNQCTWVLQEVRFYPPEGPVLKTYALDGLPDMNGSTGILEAAPAERIIQRFVPMKWPEYLHITDLPFSESLYANLR
jgi:hypothetical protein